MKQILFISHFLNRNGTEAFMMNVYRRLDRSRYSVDFLIFSSTDTDYTREIEARGDRVYRLPSRKQGMLRYLKALDEFFRQHADYDVIHWCTGNLSSIAPLRAAARHGIRTRIIHAHNSNSSGLHNKVLHYLNRPAAGRLATHRLACSEKAATYFFGRRDAQVIRNGIDTELYRFNPATRAEIRQQLGIEDGELVVGHVGRFNPVKNQRRLLSFLSQLQTMGAHARLMLIGEGETLEDTKTYAHELKLDKQVLWIGTTNRVDRYLQAMDVFVMPSWFEGLPFVLVEAQAAGLPCVLSDTIQADSRINDNVSFLNLDSPDANWAQHIMQMGNQIRTDRADHVRQQGYDICTTIQQIENSYNA